MITNQNSTFTANLVTNNFYIFGIHSQDFWWLSKIFQVSQLLKDRVDQHVTDTWQQPSGKHWEAEYQQPTSDQYSTIYLNFFREFSFNGVFPLSDWSRQFFMVYYPNIMIAL